MLRFRSCLLLAALAAPVAASAQALTVNGLADRTVYADTVSFNVVTQAGFRYEARLDASAVPAGPTVTVAAPDFHELFVNRSNMVSGELTNLYVRFIVRKGERGSSEWGLPPQVPWPVIDSAPQEWTGGTVSLMMPAAFPAGYDVPVVVRVPDASGHALRANGRLVAEGRPDIRLKRGVGSGFLGTNLPAGTVTYSPSLTGLTATRSMQIETGTTWTPVSGVLAGSVTWPANSRIVVTTNLSLAAGATLNIGAGTIVRLNPRVNFTNNGTLLINGSVTQPVVFMPNSRTQPWGGFILREGSGSITGTGVIFTGSGGDPSWFGASGNPGSHRTEQALFFVANTQRITLTDAAAVYLNGQLGHAVAGGTFELTRFLMQRTTTGGEFTGANFTVNDSAFIECPDDSINFVDGDNDGLYLVSGTHGFTNTLFGWTKDDGIDSGGDGVGTLNYQSCWFEGTFHEGNSLSGSKTVFTRDTVYFDCGQGIEDGYGGPVATVSNCLFLVCQSGARFGDNYDNIGAYTGFLRVRDSILLNNHRDLFARTWRANAWTNELDQFEATGNRLTAADPYFPANSVWDPAAEGARLAGFQNTALDVVGAGFAVRAGQSGITNFPGGLPVGLSTFSPHEVTVNYVIERSDGAPLAGTLSFPAGTTRSFIPVPSFTGVMRVALVAGAHAAITGPASLYFQNLPPVTGVTTSLIATGSVWRYLDDGSSPALAWRTNSFDDSSWAAGPAELGYGDGDERTLVRSNNAAGQRIITTYFRRAFPVADPTLFTSLRLNIRRDDGVVVYFNGLEVFRNNLPAGTITSATLAPTSINARADEIAFISTNPPPSALRAGTNLVAVEIHQQSNTSSDISFELELIGQITPPAKLDIRRFGADAVVYWADPAYGLETAPTANGPWTLQSGVTSPAAQPATGQRYYRLRR